MLTKLENSYLIALTKGDPHKVSVAVFFVGSSFLAGGFNILNSYGERQKEHCGVC